jgi:glyceraldehyde 3-phosphate dehydrogenase
LTRIGINGFGRMGRLALRAGWERDDVEFAHVNVDDPRSAIVDLPSTMVVAGTQVKVYAWYDNEWGYANRLVELAAIVSRGLAA